MNFYLWARFVCLFVMAVGITSIVIVPWILLYNVRDEVDVLSKSNAELTSKGTDRCRGQAVCEERKDPNNTPRVFECSTDYVKENICECPLEESCSVAKPATIKYSCQEGMLEILDFADEDEVFMTDRLFPAARLAGCA